VSTVLAEHDDRLKTCRRGRVCMQGKQGSVCQWPAWNPFSLGFPWQGVVRKRRDNSTIRTSSKDRIGP